MFDNIGGKIKTKIFLGEDCTQMYEIINYALKFQTDDGCKNYISKMYEKMSETDKNLIYPLKELPSKDFR